MMSDKIYLFAQLNLINTFCYYRLLFQKLRYDEFTRSRCTQLCFFSYTDGMDTERLKGMLPEIIEDNIKEIFDIL